jgi:hypothetical protein
MKSLWTLNELLLKSEENMQEEVFTLYFEVLKEWNVS